MKKLRKKLKVYIAGPMRGLPKWNFPAFDEAEQLWRAEGHQPFSPAQVDRAIQYGPAEAECDDGHLKHVIHMDIACILAADAVALLPGWEDSMGATVELALAQFINLPVYNALTMERIYPPSKPWSHFRCHAEYYGENWSEYLKENRDALQNAQRQHGLPGTGEGDSREEYPDPRYD